MAARMLWRALGYRPGDARRTLGCPRPGPLATVLPHGGNCVRLLTAGASAPSARSVTTNESLSALSAGERVLYDKLQASLSPVQLEVQDISGGCGSMYRIAVISPRFAGVSKVAQHRMVNECLKEDIKLMHGLQLTTAAPTTSSS